MDNNNEAPKKSTKILGILFGIGLVIELFLLILGLIMYFNVSKAVKKMGYKGVMNFYKTVTSGEDALEEDTEGEFEWVDDTEEDFDYTLTDAETIGEYYKFSLDGKEYEVPFSFSLLKDAGYTFDTEDPSTYMLKSNQCFSETFYDASGDVQLGEIEVFNPKEEEASEADCVVVSFLLYDDMSYGGTFEQNLTLRDGIGLGSTQEEVRAAFGEPGYVDDQSDETTVYDEWILDDDMNNMFYVGYIDGKVALVGIDYWGSYNPQDSYYDPESEDNAIVLDDEDLVIE